MMKVKNQHLVSDKAARRVVDWILVIQNKFASVMNKGFSKLSLTKRKIAVAFFSMIGGGLSIYYICEAVIGATKKSPAEKIGSFQIPGQLNPREEETHNEIFLDQETWNKVQVFKHYMDSLKSVNSPEYYIIIDTRPGLMDSIRALEEIYYQSQKIK
jgi:hypothetical protein